MSAGPRGTGASVKEVDVPANYLSENASYPPIEHYAIIGDCRSAGLISRDGSLDWLCLPRFDSPSIFAALLGAENGGRFLVRPIGEFRTERRYLANTNVLETVFHTSTGACVLRDLMSVSSEEDKRAYLTPEHEVLRELEGLEGVVEVEILYDPRPDYGRIRPLLEQRGAFGLWCEIDGEALVLRSELPLELTDGDRCARGAARIRSGERKYLSLTYSTEAPAVVPLLGEAARGRIERTVRWWQEWANRCAYEGPYRDGVVRSALTLKLMTYAPSGALVAAPTTSLPETIGGVRNWDYRYCWLRDASFTLRALFALGYREEAEAYTGWLLHATRLTWPELQVLYDVFGEAKLPERELVHLEGYAGSRPVRIGNDAQGQLQLDVYGEVINGAARLLDRGGRFDRDTKRMLDGLGRTVCRRWREPDEGIWEGRSGRFHNTHSKVLCWVALDRLIEMHEAGYLGGLGRPLPQGAGRDPEGDRGARVQRADRELHAHLRWGRDGCEPADPAALRLHRRQAPANAFHLRPHPREARPPWASLPVRGEHPRRAPARRRRFRHLQLLGGGMCGPRRQCRRSHLGLRATALLRERCGPLRRRDRPRYRRGSRELPAGVHPHRSHQRGAYDRRIPGRERTCDC